MSNANWYDEPKDNILVRFVKHVFSAIGIALLAVLLGVLVLVQLVFGEWGLAVFVNAGLLALTWFWLTLLMSAAGCVVLVLPVWLVALLFKRAIVAEKLSRIVVLASAIIAAIYVGHEAYTTPGMMITKAEVAGECIAPAPSKFRADHVTRLVERKYENCKKGIAY